MAMGAVTVAVWGNIDGGIFNLYEIVPGFVVNLLVTIVISLVTYSPNAIIDREFDMAAELSKDWSNHKEYEKQMIEYRRNNPDGYEPRSATIRTEDGDEIELPK